MTQIKTAEAHGHFHRLHIVLIMTLALLAVGGTLLGLSQTVWNIQNIQNPLPNQEVIVPLDPTETPKTSTPTTTKPSTVIPALEVVWEEIKLPPLKYGFDGIMGFEVENDSNAISVYRCIGPANNGDTTRYSLWRTEDAGKTWKEIKEGIAYNPESIQEKELREKLYEMFESQIIPSINLGIIPMGLDGVTIDPNNSNNLLASVGVAEIPPPSSDMPVKLQEQLEKQRELVKDQKLNTHRIFLSTDGGKSWIEVIPTPGKQAPRPISFALVSSQTYLNIYIGTDKNVWQTNLNIKSLTSR